MSTPPSVAPLAAMLADLTSDLRRGISCLLVCDKGWMLPLFRDLRRRLNAKNIRCEYLDGRPAPGSDAPADVGVMLTAITQIRTAVRRKLEEVEGIVFALPHLDVMTTTEGGWTNISREVIPLLYENAAVQWLGFRDPSLPLPPIVEKVFGKCYTLETPYRVIENVIVTPQPVPEPSPDQTSPTESANPPEEAPPAPDETSRVPEETSGVAAELPTEVLPNPASEEPSPGPPADTSTSSPDAPG